MHCALNARHDSSMSSFVSFGHCDIGLVSQAWYAMYIVHSPHLRGELEHAILTEEDHAILGCRRSHSHDTQGIPIDHSSDQSSDLNGMPVRLEYAHTFYLSQTPQTVSV